MSQMTTEMTTADSHKDTMIQTLSTISHGAGQVNPLHLPKVEIPTLDMASGKKVEGGTYQNNLANAMHSLSDVRALDFSNVKAESQLDYLKHYNANFKGHLDGATNNRKSGILLASTSPKGVIEKYFDGGKRVTHGSILFSECRKMFSINALKYVVLTDNDPGMGDCHGIIAQSLYDKLRKYYWLVDNAGIQFRLGVVDQWVAKGVVIPYPDSYLPAGVQLALPDSSFKGRCPELGVVQSHDSVFGILGVSKRRSFKSSHQVLQCFTSSGAQEYIRKLCGAAMRDLIHRRQDSTSFAQFMLESLPEDGDNANVMPVLQVTARDKYYQLAKHPLVVKKLNELFRKRVAEIATGKFIPATGLTATPLDNLKPGYVLSNSLPTGDYLSFRYPVRHYGDIRQVKVVNPNDPVGADGKEVDIKRRLSAALVGGQSKLTEHQKYFCQTMWTGTFAINTAYAAEVGMDFDGDMVAFLSAHDHPILAKEVKSWKPLPTIQKPEKKPHGKSVEQVAVDSMQNQVQILASMMSKCRLYGLTEEFAYLGEQIQLVVDSLKSDTGVDVEYINALGKRISKLVKADINAGHTPWVSFYKERNLYLDGVVPTVSELHAHDTISQCFQVVNDLYINGLDDPLWGMVSGQSVFASNDVKEFSHIFTEVVPTTNTTATAEIRLSTYRKECAEALQAGQSCDPIFEKWQAWVDELRTRLPQEQITHIASAMWRNECRRGKNCYFIFRFFTDELIHQLQTFQGSSFRLWRNQEKAPAAFDEYDNDVMTAYVGENSLGQPYLYGLANDKTLLLGRVIVDNKGGDVCIPMSNLSLDVRINSVRNKEGQVSYQLVEILDCKATSLVGE